MSVLWCSKTHSLSHTKWLNHLSFETVKEQRVHGELCVVIRTTGDSVVTWWLTEGRKRRKELLCPLVPCVSNFLSRLSLEIRGYSCVQIELKVMMAYISCSKPMPLIVSTHLSHSWLARTVVWPYKQIQCAEIGCDLGATRLSTTTHTQADTCSPQRRTTCSRSFVFRPLSFCVCPPPSWLLISGTQSPVPPVPLPPSYCPQRPFQTYPFK